jgi:hypothetical protein
MSFLLYLNIFPSTKLEKSTEQDLPGIGGGRGKGEKMVQTMYTHMNK